MSHFIVGLQCGGLMEDPGIRYENIETVEAETAKQAEKIYNKKHKCNFFYAKCLGRALEGDE